MPLLPVHVDGHRAEGPGSAPGVAQETRYPQQTRGCAQGRLGGSDPAAAAAGHATFISPTRTDRLPPWRGVGRRAPAASTGRSSPWPCPPSSRWSPSRSSCWPTPRSWATSAPPSWPASASPRSSCGWPSGSASSSPTRPPRRWPGSWGPGRPAEPSSRAWTASGWPCSSASCSPSPVCSPPSRSSRSSAPTPEVTAAATTYLRISWLGLTPMLLLLAATGVLRGLADTRTPLVVAVAANLLNVVLNVVLVYGFDLGIGGSAAGTVLAQTAPPGSTSPGPCSAPPRREGATWHPDLPGVRRAARAGSALLVRTLNLHACLLTMTWGAASLGRRRHRRPPAGLHAVDLPRLRPRRPGDRRPDPHRDRAGAGDVERTRSLTRRMIRLGLGFGVVTGVVLALGAPVLGRLFVDDPAVVDALAPALLVAAVAQPLAGVVFVLDGILIGAGDGRYLAVAGHRGDGRLRAGGAARGLPHRGPRRRPSGWSGSGSRSAWCSWAGGAWCCCDGPAAPTGW